MTSQRPEPHMEDLGAALRRSAAQPRARWSLFGVTRRNLDAARDRLLAALEADAPSCDESDVEAASALTHTEDPT